MKITEVRIFPTESKDGKLKAFATMTFDDWFVVRNVKVIQGNNGLFVAMPSRKAMDSCPKCHFKNVVGSKYCNQCGGQLSQQPPVQEAGHEAQGSHMDIAHPITQECRVYIQEQVLSAYNKEHGGASGKRSEKAGSEHKKAPGKKEEPSPAERPEEKKAEESAAPESVTFEDDKDIEL